MRGKKACIIVDLRGGQHVVRVPDLVAVLAAAGWQTDIALKAYGGETLKLAKQAAKDGYELIIGFGGDGTLNAVMNGIVYAGGKSVAADIPGGTYNVWAHAIGVPDDPAKAALAIVNSEPRKVDLGHVEVAGLTLPQEGSNGQLSTGSRKRRKQPKISSNIRQHFLLHVGLGLEATMMAHISRPLKYHIGPLAFDLAAAKELPKQRPFPVEVQGMDNAGNIHTQWQGEVWQVFVSKVPYFGGSVTIEPTARADDGLLYVCLITANNPVQTFEQVCSILLQRKLDKETTRYFQGKHFSIRIPASTDMHVDGSVIKLEEILNKSERSTLQHASTPGQVMVNYRFDVEPAALPMAIPRTYQGPLFAKSPQKGNSHSALEREQHEQGSLAQKTAAASRKIPWVSQQQIQALQASASEVTVVGVTSSPRKRPTYIIACKYKKQETDETEVIAVQVDDHTLVFNSKGVQISPETVLDLQEGMEILVAGKKTKRGVIRADYVALKNHA